MVNANKRMHVATSKFELQDTELKKLNEAIHGVERKNVILTVGTIAKTTVLSTESAIKLLSGKCFLRRPSDSIQELAHTIMTACTMPGGSEIILKWREKKMSLRTHHCQVLEFGDAKKNSISRCGRQIT